MACDQASLPDEEPPLALRNATVTGATGRNTLLDDHGEHNPTAEVADVLKLELQFLVRAEPVLEEAANRHAPLEGIPCAHPPLKDCIGSVEADHRVQVAPVCGLEGNAREFNKVGGRGLLGHDSVSIAQDDYAPEPSSAGAAALGT